MQNTPSCRRGRSARRRERARRASPGCGGSRRPRAAWARSGRAPRAAGSPRRVPRSRSHPGSRAFGVSAASPDGMRVVDDVTGGTCGGSPPGPHATTERTENDSLRRKTHVRRLTQFTSARLSSHALELVFLSAVRVDRVRRVAILAHRRRCGRCRSRRCRGGDARRADERRGCEPVVVCCVVVGVRRRRLDVDARLRAVDARPTELGRRRLGSARRRRHDGAARGRSPTPRAGGERATEPTSSARSAGPSGPRPSSTTPMIVEQHEEPERARDDRQSPMHGQRHRAGERASP